MDPRNGRLGCALDPSVFGPDAVANANLENPVTPAAAAGSRRMPKPIEEQFARYVATGDPTALGAVFDRWDIQIAYTPVGVTLALVFIGLPFVVRTVQPVLIDLETEMEEAAATLGASRLQTVVQVVLPSLLPALLTGFALAFARASGEYGSVIFIAGNLPMVSEIAPLLIVTRLQEFAYAEATAIATVMLLISFVVLLAINLLQRWADRRGRR